MTDESLAPRPHRRFTVTAFHPPDRCVRVWIRGSVNPALAATARIHFDPSAQLLQDAETRGTFPALAPVVVPDQNGSWQAQVLATDDPTINPTRWTYTVTEPGRVCHIMVPHDRPPLDSPGDPLHGQPVLHIDALRAPAQRSESIPVCTCADPDPADVLHAGTCQPVGQYCGSCGMPTAVGLLRQIRALPCPPPAAAKRPDPARTHDPVRALLEEEERRLRGRRADAVAKLVAAKRAHVRSTRFLALLAVVVVVNLFLGVLVTGWFSLFFAVLGGVAAGAQLTVRQRTGETVAARESGLRHVQAEYDAAFARMLAAEADDA